MSEGCIDQDGIDAARTRRSAELVRFEEMKSKSLAEKEAYSLDLIRRTMADYKPEEMSVACSFGKDSMLVLYLVRQVAGGKDVWVNFQNTGVEFPETVAFGRQVVKDWNLKYVELKPIKTFGRCLKEYGPPHTRFLAKKGENRRTPKCCKYLKEDPAKRFFKGTGVKVSFDGITWDESYTRRWRIILLGDSHYDKSRMKVLKVMPIAYWTVAEVWEYTRSHGIPINPAYEKYKIDRIGCVPCSGHKHWREEMSRTHPKWFRIMARATGEPAIDDWTD